MNNIRENIKTNLPTLGEDVSLKNKKHLGLVVFLIIYIITLVYVMYSYRLYVFSTSAETSTSSATLTSTNEGYVRSLTSNIPNSQFAFTIFGNKIFWWDFRNSLNSLGELYLFDLSTNTDKKYSDYASKAVAISDNYLAYVKNTSSDKLKYAMNLMLYNLSTSTEKQITTHPEIMADNHDANVFISGNKLIWGNVNDNLGVGPDFTLKLYDIASNTQRTISSITWYAKGGGVIGFSGNYILINKYLEPNLNDTTRQYGQHYDLYVYDLSTNTEKLIEQDAGENAAIDGNKILYTINKPFSYLPNYPLTITKYLYIYDITAGTKKVLLSRSQTLTTSQDRLEYKQWGSVKISGDKIAYFRQRGTTFPEDANSDVFLYDMATNKEIQITNTATKKFDLSISNSRVIWTDRGPADSSGSCIVINNTCKGEVYIYDPPGSIPIVLSPIAAPSSTLSPTPMLPSIDSDRDGYSNAVELYIGTNPNKACITDLVNDVDNTKPGQPSKTWPADLNTTAGAISSFNKINIMDITSFTAPIRRLDASSASANFDRRWDLNADRKIDIVDLTSVNITAPPMLNNVRAFNGPPCPI